MWTGVILQEVHPRLHSGVGAAGNRAPIVPDDGGVCLSDCRDADSDVCVTEASGVTQKVRKTSRHTH